MIKILYVTDFLKQRFGVTNFILNYLKNISKEKIEFSVLAYEGSEDVVVKELESNSCKVFFMPKLTLSNVFKFESFIKKFFEVHYFDIVHSHFNQIDNLIFKSAKRSGTKICICHSHSTKMSVSKLKSFRNKLMRIGSNRKADYWAACSEDAGISMFGKSFRNSSKKVLINNAIDSEKYLYNNENRLIIRKRYGIPDDCILIGHVGSLKPEKNHIFLLKIFKEYKKINSFSKLVLIGDGDLKESLVLESEKLGIADDLIFTGSVNNVEDYLSALDYFVFPSIFEGLGISVIEALNSGLFCFVSDAVPKETRISDNIIYLSLSLGEQRWAKAIADQSILRRDPTRNLALEHGFDIKTECKKLETFYIDALMRR